ncbi:MAG TPA: hypothetical protein DCP31_28375, partial [Cyanobacteria bacterium UBA8543]|nr:hypothetical protein [Cyanobacteria bacterium UBA8543]
MSRYSANDWDGTIDRLNAALESMKVLPKTLDREAIYFYRANAYYYKGKKDRAILDYNQALKLNPCHALAYNNRGAAYADKGENDRAILDYNQAL